MSKKSGKNASETFAERKSVKNASEAFAER